jgi:proline dehydrogenase
VKKALKKAVLSLAMPIMQRAARAYVAGTELSDALQVCRKLAARGFSATTAFWDGPDADPRQVADAHLAAVAAVAAENPDYYISLKAPSLHYSRELFQRLSDASQKNRVRLHFDSLDLDSAEPTLALIADILPLTFAISLTLPGRWKRSLEDVDWALANNVIIRIVKGQWPDPNNADSDLRANFMNVIKRAAGRAQHVAVASHDPEIVRPALKTLTDAGTSCELELLYGLPVRSVLPIAKEMGTSVRFYIPYGHAWLPYSLSQARRNPRIFWWTLKDALLNRSDGGIYS